MGLPSHEASRRVSKMKEILNLGGDETSKSLLFYHFTSKIGNDTICLVFFEMCRNHQLVMDVYVDFPLLLPESNQKGATKNLVREGCSA